MAMANEAVTGRYNRQELIEGWNQEKLGNSRVVILGSGTLANFTAASLVALGIGGVEVYDADKVGARQPGEFLLYNANPEEQRAKALEAILAKINPETRVKGISMRLENSPLISIIGKPDVVIDLTNSPSSKSTVLKYAQSKGVTVVSASADEVRAEMYVIKPGEVQEQARLGDYQDKIQGSIPSEVMGGLITEEVRKILMPIDGEMHVKNLAYSTASSRRFSRDLEFEVKQTDLEDKKVLVVGAGALGNFVALGAALAGIGNIDIMDYDEVESTNLNRQILFFDAVGKKKAEALAARVSEIAPNARVRGIVGKLDENSKLPQNYDLILDCVDSFGVRAVINYFAVRNQIPLVSGGTDPRSGQVTVYEPGKSACLDCVLGVERALAKERTTSSCKYAPDPSVIMSNEVVGGMIVGEAVKVLDRSYGEPVRRVLKYDSTVSVRGGLIGSEEVCDCKKPNAASWIKQVIEKYGEKK